MDSGQIEGNEIEGAALALDGEVERLFLTETAGQLAGKALAGGAGLHGDTQDHIAVLLRAHRDRAAVAVALQIDAAGRETWGDLCHL